LDILVTNVLGTQVKKKIEILIYKKRKMLNSVFGHLLVKVLNIVKSHWKLCSQCL
jgi:hypothetical protein